MKDVLYTEQALLQLQDSVQQLVEERYFSEEDYALDYIRDIFRYFALNLENSVAYEAPTYFNRYSVDGHKLYYVKYRKSAHTTWYAFYEDLETIHSIVYLGNNHYIGHLLDIHL